jgi:hypothetical protein
MHQRTRESTRGKANGTMYVSGFQGLIQSKSLQDVQREGDHRRRSSLQPPKVLPSRETFSDRSVIPWIPSVCVAFDSLEWLPKLKASNLEGIRVRYLPAFEAGAPTSRINRWTETRLL